MADSPTTTLNHDAPPSPRLRAPFPPKAGSARPVAQDRWERVVSTVVIPSPLTAIWDALTNSASIGQWLAKTTSHWARPQAEVALDFEDGEFFWCHIDEVEAPSDDTHGAYLSYRWRWVGIGPATEVDWQLIPLGDVTGVTVTESATNGPADWRSWNGMGWPGILDQLADFVKTGRNVRWTWRRMGPYIQTELPVASFEAWAALTSVPALRFWMGRSTGSLAVGDPMRFILGDASGAAHLTVSEHVEPNQRFPSYQPSLNFTLQRGGWAGPLGGHLWIEPAGLGASLLQVFHHGWEMFGSTPSAPSDRALLTNFWTGAFGRAKQLLGPPPGPSLAAPSAFDPPGGGPHSWSR